MMSCYQMCKQTNDPVQWARSLECCVRFVTSFSVHLVNRQISGHISILKEYWNLKWKFTLKIKCTCLTVINRCFSLKWSLCLSKEIWKTYSEVYNSNSLLVLQVASHTERQLSLQRGWGDVARSLRVDRETREWGWTSGEQGRVVLRDLFATVCKELVWWGENWYLKVICQGSISRTVRLSNLLSAKLYSSRKFRNRTVSN